MNRAVFVNPHTVFLERMNSESEGKALTTTSMMEALKWIANPIYHLSGVFLNPDDTTFSALHFIELTLSHRPALPIFLLEGKLAQNKNSANKVSQCTSIRGVFSGTEPYLTMVASLKTNIKGDETKPRETPPKQMYAGYISVPVSDFFTGTQYQFDVFIAGTEGDVRLFAPKDSNIDAEYLKHLMQKNSFLLVKEEDIKATRSKIQEIKKTVASNPDIPTKWKSSEVMVNAKSLIDEMKSSGVAENMVAHTQNMLGDLYSLLNRLDLNEENEDENAGNLFDIIDRAKKCDRAVFCASYSILLCKQMRYEKATTLEILGFASILQDVSLYKTPYGDLSEKKPSSMSPEEFKYYQKHPVLSTDLVAVHTDLPQVTLQVIRQAHERRNKSGFPNKIGGSLLHGMSEILSLINTYFEITKENYAQAELIDHLNRNVFPNYSENLVISFKQVFGNVLKGKILSDANNKATG